MRATPGQTVLPAQVYRAQTHISGSPNFTTVSRGIGGRVSAGGRIQRRGQQYKNLQPLDRHSSLSSRRQVLHEIPSRRPTRVNVNIVLGNRKTPSASGPKRNLFINAHGNGVLSLKHSTDKSDILVRKHGRKASLLISRKTNAIQNSADQRNVLNGPKLPSTSFNKAAWYFPTSRVDSTKSVKTSTTGGALVGFHPKPTELPNIVSSREIPVISSPTVVPPLHRSTTLGFLAIKETETNRPVTSSDKAVAMAGKQTETMISPTTYPHFLKTTLPISVTSGLLSTQTNYETTNTITRNQNFLKAGTVDYLESALLKLLSGKLMSIYPATVDRISEKAKVDSDRRDTRISLIDTSSESDSVDTSDKTDSTDANDSSDVPETPTRD